MVTRQELAVAVTAAARRSGYRPKPDELEELTQETVCELLQWLKAQGEREIEEAELYREAKLAARRAWHTWQTQTAGTVKLGEIPQSAVSAIDLGVSLDDRPSWLPVDLWPVAWRIARGDSCRQIEQETGISKSEVSRQIRRLRELRIPDKRLEWFSAVSDARRAKSEPWYAKTGSTPKSLGDIPPLVEMPDCGDDQINLLSDRAGELDKSVWEGLIHCLFAVSRPHGHQTNAKLRWTADYATCGARENM